MMYPTQRSSDSLECGIIIMLIYPTLSHHPNNIKMLGVRELGVRELSEGELKKDRNENNL